ncbi:MAG: hypothetical protein QN597_10640, partial [Nitrososphaeraceae archaeon]|nr:hypothetical protein [Nitrososphaeraceae archaeon]
MNKELIVIGAMISMLVFTTSANNSYAQNATANASNAAGNMTASAKQSASEMGQNTSAINRTELAQNASSAFNKSGITLGEIGKNASPALNKTGESLQEMGKNATEVGGAILNKTGEGVKGFLGGAADVVSNISKEVK